MKIAVTGASGFIGAHVLAELQHYQVEITAVTRDASRLQNLPPDVNVVELDITSPSNNCYEQIGSPGVLIHLAWDGLPNYKSSHHFESELPKQYNFLKSLAEAGLPAMLVTGTCFEYGMQSGSLSEELQPLPDNPYGYAKDALRKQLEFLKSAIPFNLIWGRLFYMFGEGQSATSIYPLLKNAVMRGDKTFNMSGGEQLRDYLPVTEVARRIVQLAVSGKNIGTVNICSGQPVSVRRLVEKWLKENNCYCTWYSDKFGAAGTEKSTEEFAAVAAKKLVPWGLSFFQVDDRWQGGMVTNCLRRDFRTVRADGPYSSGLAKTASNLRAKGVRTGLWFLPFCGSQGDPAFADKKDLFVRSRLTTRRLRERDAKSRDGVDWLYPEMDNDANAPYECFWGGTAIDYTNPKSANYLRDLVRRFRDEWGVSYLKFDALFGAVATLHMYPSDEYRADDLGEQIFHDPKATNMENARKALETLRAAAGKDMFLLGCNLSQSMRTMVSAYGIVDAMRVGPDNSPMWDGIKAGPVRGTSRYFLNGRVWYNDPDPVYVRNKIPSSHARVSATWASMSGDLFAFSDWLPDLSDERVNILRRTIAPHRRPTKVRPIDLFESDIANTWLLADGESRIFGFFNWDEKKPLTVNYEAKYAGLDPEATYVGFDFWENKFIAPFKGAVRADIGAGDAKVWQLREFDGTRPVLVSTSRHIASPLFEVTDETWDASARTLSGSSEVVAGDSYELRIVLPEGMSVAATEIGGAKAKVWAEGRSVRIRTKPCGGGVIRWSVRFDAKPDGSN